MRVFRLLHPLLVAGLILATLPKAAAEALPTVVDKVLLQQPSVRSAQALLRAAEAQIRQVRSDFLPSLGFAYRSADSRDETQGNPIDRNVRRTDGSLRWNLFNGATDSYRLISSTLYRDAADADLDEVLEKVAYEITETYSDVVRLRQTLESLQATLARQERVEANVARRVEAGRISPAELDLITVRIIQNRAQLGQIRAQLGTAEYRYRLLTGENPDQLTEPALLPAEQEADPEALVARIQERNPRLRAALRRASARQAEVGVARGSFFPAVDLELAKRMHNNTDPVPVSDTQYSSQIRVSIDIPLGGKNLARHSEAVERYQSAQADADDQLLKASREITDLSRQLAEARAIAPQLARRVVSAQRVAAAYELHFEAGRRSLNDLSIAQEDLFEGQRTLVENRARQVTLQAQLLALAGELRPALKSRYQAAPVAPELLGTTPPPAAQQPTPAMTMPAPSAAATATAPGKVAANPEERVASWAAAWSAGDFTAYRKHYSTDFLPPRAASTAAWEEERRRRLEGAEQPEVRVEALETRLRGADRALTRFVQHYRSRQYQDRVHKQLDWVKVDGEWKISAETVLSVPGQMAAATESKAPAVQ